MHEEKERKWMEREQKCPDKIHKGTVQRARKFYLPDVLFTALKHT